MNLFIGIVGLPNVGKSTLFNAITNSNVEAANYPFATIKPNVGVVSVPDQRLMQLSKLINPLFVLSFTSISVNPLFKSIFFIYTPLLLNYFFNF